MVAHITQQMLDRHWNASSHLHLLCWDSAEQISAPRHPNVTPSREGSSASEGKNKPSVDCESARQRRARVDVAATVIAAALL